MVTKLEIERLAIVETKIDSLTFEQRETNKKLDKFISAADSTYARKSEVNELRTELKDTRKSLMALISRWGPLIGVLALLAKDLII